MTALASLYCVYKELKYSTRHENQRAAWKYDWIIVIGGLKSI
jgi:hypothetical protein